MLYPSSQTAGSSSGVTVTGGGFAPNESVLVSYVGNLTAGGTAVEQMTVLAFPNGTFVAPNLPVPVEVSPGSYTVTATGQQSNTTATASLTVLAPGTTPTITPTSTPTPTPTPTPTASSASTLAPAIILDKVLILHAVKTQHVSTQTLHLGEQADFYVLYHTVNPGKRKPSASLTITKDGKLLLDPKLTSLILGHHAAFGVHLAFSDKKFLGRLYAHFKVMLASSSEKRDRRFYVVT